MLQDRSVFEKPISWPLLFEKNFSDSSNMTEIAPPYCIQASCKRVCLRTSCHHLYCWPHRVSSQRYGIKLFQNVVCLFDICDPEGRVLFVFCYEPYLSSNSSSDRNRGGVRFLHSGRPATAFFNAMCSIMLLPLTFSIHHSRHCR